MSWSMQPQLSENIWPDSSPKSLKEKKNLYIFSLTNIYIQSYLQFAVFQDWNEKKRVHQQEWLFLINILMYNLHKMVYMKLKNGQEYSITWGWEEETDCETQISWFLQTR